jgi:hypothetical protein
LRGVSIENKFALEKEFHWRIFLERTARVPQRTFLLSSGMEVDLERFSSDDVLLHGGENNTMSSSPAEV